MIDFDNRLPRGRTYAGNGSVTDIRIQSNTIKAKVEGSMPRPYNITISIPTYTCEQKKKLVSGIKKDPLILSKLLNRELPQELHCLALDQDIMLFPSSWKDFIMECSYPDWVVPCKHFAAVIYVVSKEIDANPFLVLKLHCLDLADELKTSEIEISQHVEEETPMVEEMLINEVFEKEEEPGCSFTDLPDFSQIPSGKDTLISLLTPNPLFFHRDFRSVLQSVYNSISKTKRDPEPEILTTKLEQFRNKLDVYDDTMVLLGLDLNVEDVVFNTTKGTRKSPVA